MKFSIPSKPLLQALMVSQKAIHPRSTMPILSCVLVEATGDTLAITADSLDQRITQRLPDASIEQSGSICIPAKQLIAAIRGDTVEIELSSNKVTVISGGRSVLGCLPATDFPRWGLEQQGGPYNLSDFLRLSKQVQPCASSDPNAYVLSGVLLDMKEDQAKLVACDMKSLSSIPIEKPVVPDGLESLIFNVETLRVLHAVKAAEAGEQRLLVDGTSLRFDIGTTTVQAKSIEGMYPNWRFVVKEFENDPVKISITILLQALRSLAPFYEVIEKGCWCQVEPQGSIWAIHASNGSHSSSCEVAVEGGDYTAPFRVDPSRIIRILSAWDSKNVLINKDDTEMSFLRFQAEESHLFAMLAPIYIQK